MLIQQQFRQCATFLFVDRRTDGRVERTAMGTAFFVSSPGSSSGRATYVVTARHNLALARKYDSLYVRLMLGDRTWEDWEAPPDAWLEHPTTDVAIIPVQEPKCAAFKSVPRSMIAGDDWAATRARGGDSGIGEGDDVVFIGLFSEHPGRERIQPVVRFGTVALMPYEPITVRIPGGGRLRLDAYLVEARSWGGQSGSPAFFIDHPYRDPEIGIRTDRVGRDHGWFPSLLGLVSHHYDIKRALELPEQDDQQAEAFDDAVALDAQVRINAGIAVVIPGQKIIDLLDDRDLIAERNAMAEAEAEAEPGATPDRSASDEKCR